MVDVILVDEHDVQIGLCEKLEAHEKGLLHRAFSVYVFNKKGEILLQQRALHKYHSPGVFANTCCSHQFEGEDNESAAHRRLQEEMGFDQELTKMTELIYKTPVPTNLIEHEYLHVYAGFYIGEEIQPHPDEVASYLRMGLEEFDGKVEHDDPTIAPRTKVTRKQCKGLFEEFCKQKD